MKKSYKPKLYFILTPGFITTKVFKEGNSEIFMIVIVIVCRLSDLTKTRRRREMQKLIMLVLAKNEKLFFCTPKLMHYFLFKG